MVLKPRGMGASIGVVRAGSPAELDAAFEVAEHAGHGGSPSYEGGVLVEEMITGPEISVDGAVCDGEYRPMFVAHKQVGLAPYFEEIGHVVDAADPLLDDPSWSRSSPRRTGRSAWAAASPTPRCCSRSGGR